MYLRRPSLPSEAALTGTIQTQQPTVSEEEKAFNIAMSKVRVSVEWVFGEIVEYFAFVDFKKNQKIGLQEVGTMYITCALLQNAMTCLYGSSTSTFMGLHPPSLEEYFQ